uniref:Serine/threonine-protein kinase 11-interacting protein n=1 Tax=Leptobrachium leishanense TaxID=445787 RepID=A0A8C5QZU5_9ANUR
MPTRAENALIQALGRLLHDHGESVLDGSRVLTLLTPSLQVLNRLVEQLFPRLPVSGFQALPSHPSDSAPVLQTQFILDVFQKAPSLRLIHPSGSPGQFDVNIFPFKALKCLELRFLPPHCIRGLRFVYSRLKVLICFKCLTSLEEIISLCGGDLTSALIWLELHTLNLSFNAIRHLDHSLELLNSLNVLDLSHNRIKDPNCHLKVLDELQYLNLGYNQLREVPDLSSAAPIILRSLILRHNQLSDIRGIEQLLNLQHLDLSYNLLHDHKELSGLRELHNLQKLFLEGNPLYFHKDHRTLTSEHLSPQALSKMFMDGYLMISAEMRCAEDEFARQQTQGPVYAIHRSSNVDLTDSFPNAVCNTPPLRRRKSRVKVRTASISEPSDSDYERRPQKSEPVFKHQKEIEQAELFREKYGTDWLRYRDHLERELKEELGESACVFTSVPRQRPVGAQSLTPTTQHSQAKPKTPSPPRKTPSPPRKTPSPPRKTPSPPQETPSPTRELPKPLSEVPKSPNFTEEVVPEDYEDDGFCWGTGTLEDDDNYEIENPLGPPIAVCLIQDGRPRYYDWPFIFLRLNKQYVFDIGLERGELLDKRDLSTLLDTKTSVIRWTWKDEEQDFPLVTLFFESLIEERRRLQYVVLDDSPETSAKTLCELLIPIMEENRLARERAEAAKPRIYYRCLKCVTTFMHDDTKNPKTNERSNRFSIYSPVQAEPPEVQPCSTCGIAYVVISPCGEGPSGSRKSSGSTPRRSKSREPKSANSEEETDSPSSNSASGSSKSSSSSPPPNEEVVETEMPWKISPGCRETLDFRLVDHRLRFFIDFDIIVDHMEEYRFCLKVPVVRFGRDSDFIGVVVLSNQKIHFLEIYGEIRGSPCNWVRPGDVHNLTSLTHLHIGMNKQTLHLGFDIPGAAYTLLIGNPVYATMFSQNILETLAELPPQYLKNLVHIPDVVMTPGHPIWPLLCAKPGTDPSSPPEFLYLAVSFLKVDVVNEARENLPDCDGAFGSTFAQRTTAAKQVSLLITRTHAYVLEEAHQWNHKPQAEGSNDVAAPRDPFQVKEKEPMEAVCAVHLFPLEPQHFHIRIHNERKGNESAWLLWTEDKQMPNVVAAFVKAPWEALFQVSFDLAINENLNCCTPLPAQ